MSAERRWAKRVVAAKAYAARLAQLEKGEPAFERAGGDAVCDKCGLPLYDHPEHPTFRFLTVRCDGSLVKL